MPHILGISSIGFTKANKKSDNTKLFLEDYFPLSPYILYFVKKHIKTVKFD